MYSYVTYEVRNRVAYITLNRPEKRNALNGEVVAELQSTFTAAGADDHVKVIVLQGSGEAFCAGADLGYLQQLQKNTFEENLADSSQLKLLFETMYTLPKVIIAMVEGHAIAGGSGLATVCDYCFAVPHAKFGYTEVKIGFIPAIVAVFLVRKIGEGRARELLLSGKLIEARYAREIGLINEIVEAKDMKQYVDDFAQTLCNDASANSLGLTKQLIAAVQDVPLRDALNYAATLNAKTREHADCKKGIAAFINKEKPAW
ncbi:methylglutaconyl-CoA hydratase [Chitinophaga skermanii]|uniref:Methylglutaconyl-CoA hydratase n=1 Tax=Chitinophaga skermanii TaxID=331697 RepID=A0A327Q6Z0_9BACT|nr:enoyl-CoA hydratase-related protein [Chitinophaga skermanii]RAI99744.1 methylglutaconyl-CoA hydratase [Chitinophaga skermanii]